MKRTARHQEWMMKDHIPNLCQRRPTKLRVLHHPENKGSSPKTTHLAPFPPDPSQEKATPRKSTGPQPRLTNWAILTHSMLRLFFFFFFEPLKAQVGNLEAFLSLFWLRYFSFWEVNIKYHRSMLRFSASSHLCDVG